MNILNNVTASCEILDFKPSRTVDLSTSIPVEPWVSVGHSYKSKNIYETLLASLMNSLYTRNIPIFMLSRRVLMSVLLNDDNIHRKTVNSTEYKYFVKMLFDTGTVELVKEGSRATRKAMIFKIIHPTLVPFFESYEERCLVLKKAVIDSTSTTTPTKGATHANAPKKPSYR